MAGLIERIVPRAATAHAEAEPQHLAERDGYGALLTVIVPVYNEAATVDELLRSVVDVPLDMQVLVVDDGSTDGTTGVLERWEGHPVVELLAHSRNSGKGAAIRTGLEQAQGKYTLVQDADLEYDPRDYLCLLEPLLAGEADVVYGSRYLRSRTAIRENSGEADPETTLLTAARTLTSPATPPWTTFRIGVCALNAATRWLYGARLTDEATCYKLFRTETLRAMRLECERFEFCPEVTAKACRMGLHIAEVPVGYCPRGAAEGKKIRLRDGIEALKTLWRWRKWSR
ncbi:MAG TPA: glycosyltransferase family 2 protein [Pirellulales bacterium]|nr:glycosyltransferase family 2 protein [Pirellulales bacterium]